MTPSTSIHYIVYNSICFIIVINVSHNLVGETICCNFIIVYLSVVMCILQKRKWKYEIVFEMNHPFNFCILLIWMILENVRVTGYMWHDNKLFHILLFIMCIADILKDKTKEVGVIFFNSIVWNSTIYMKDQTWKESKFWSVAREIY